MQALCEHHGLKLSLQSAEDLYQAVAAHQDFPYDYVRRRLEKDLRRWVRARRTVSGIVRFISQDAATDAGVIIPSQRPPDPRHEPTPAELPTIPDPPGGPPTDEERLEAERHWSIARRMFLASAPDSAQRLFDALHPVAARDGLLYLSSADPFDAAYSRDEYTAEIHTALANFNLLPEWLLPKFEDAI